MTFQTPLPINKLNRKAIIWAISGADCSGGAGIAADIKTGHKLKVEVCHLLTANTVQNSQQLIAINPTAVDILDAQAQALRFDKPPSVIKIGLIANSAQVTWLVTLLMALKQQLTNLIVIYDPVGQASVGGSLSSVTAIALRALLPLIDIITPNLIEAQQLNVLSTHKVKHNPLQLAEQLLTLGCKAVIIKGGHTESTESSKLSAHCTDLCLQRLNSTSSSISTQTIELRSPRITTSYSHGGGCSFASALASFLAHGYLLRDAFTLTKAFINQGLSLSSQRENNHSNQSYYGAFEQGSWPSQPEHFPQVISPLAQRHQISAKFPSLDLKTNEKLGLYPVIDSLEWLERLLPLNLNIIQLRIKNKNSEELDSIIEKAVTLARLHSCRLFINDYWQLAIKHGAYGIHIGQEDLAKADLSAIANAGLRLGISTHGCYEFLLAKQLQPSYLAIGAIFPTKTKDMTGQIQGLENLMQILSLAEHIPVIAIGGINQQRIERVWRTNVSAVAVVTAITEAKQPIAATQSMQAILKN
tara:strand:- start:4638 stop:6224 length:1587 start_codon:yes stop_codon:yes gene_type:complete